jgi:Nitrate and nitrite sensing
VPLALLNPRAASERDETTGLIPVTNTNALNSAYAATDAPAARVQSLASGIGGSYPANIQSRVATVVSEITHLHSLRVSAQASQSALAVIADYSTPITDMIALNGQIAQGTSDAQLVNDVQTLNALSLAKDQAAQQRALLFSAFKQQIFADGVQQALTTAESEERTDLTAFDTTATPAEQSTFQNTVAGPRVNEAQNIEIYAVGTGSLAIGAGALGIGPNAAPAAWGSAQSGKVDDMQQVEVGVAQNIVARAQALQSGAEGDALFTAIVTVVILLLVLVEAVGDVLTPGRPRSAGILIQAERAVTLPGRVSRGARRSGAAGPPP